MLISLLISSLLVAENPKAFTKPEHSGESTILIATDSNDEQKRDTLKESYAVSSAKQILPEGKLSVNTTSIFLKDIKQRGLKNPKMLSAIVPNLHIPDYGSAMTSSIYMRGIGSRIDNPSIGLYLDDFPVMDKNAYDFSFLDIRKAEMLSGPQGTLYGRNSIAGLLEISTLSPDDFTGEIIEAEAGPVEGSASVSIYRGSAESPKGGIALSIGGNYSRGYYTNSYNGEKCDPSYSLNGRAKYTKLISGGDIRLENILSVSWLDQGGYPYRQFIQDSDTDKDFKATEGTHRVEGGYLLPINYNDTCSYRRLFILEGFKLSGKGGLFNWNSMTSLQFLSDRMDMDQDFTPKSMFTLRQSRREIDFTHETILRPAEHPDWWDSQSGAFIFFRHDNMDAPVTFKEDGIKTLILDNANANIPDWLNGTLTFKDKTLPINSTFGLSTGNIALYHESYFTLGKWLLTAGIRADFEANNMNYDSRASLQYRFEPLMQAWRPYTETYKGKTSNSYLELLPKISALYDAGNLKIYSSISRGYKSGGFNTQIFSDILQNLLMNGMMEDVGIYLDDVQSIGAGNTSYKPETSMNYEIGLKFNRSFAEGYFRTSLALFRIDCLNQQITVFPPGQSTGRMMANAGSSRSYGAEISASGKWRNLSLSASYGYTDARFVKYHNGNEDFSGKKIPYSPENTLYVRAGWDKRFARGVVKGISVAADCNGNGKIYWNESNTLYHGFTPLLGGDISVDFGKFTVYSRGENLLDEDYRTFWFKSVGNNFCQDGKGRRFVAGIRITL